MPDDTNQWFIRDRSEALAALLLTSRKDVHLRDERKTEDGIDLLMGVNGDDPLSTRLFVVQVKGTASADKNQWLAQAKQLFRPASNSIYLPVCLFVVNVRSNEVLYTWLAEPFIEDASAKLKFLPADDFHELTPQRRR
jgi:hypothetical protein